MHRAVRTILALASATMLSGCIAAAAIPLLAGGAVVTTTVDGEDASFENEAPRPGLEGVVAVEGAEDAAPSLQGSADGRFVVLDRSSLPAPGEAVSGDNEQVRDLIAERLAEGSMQSPLPGQLPSDAAAIGPSGAYSQFLGYALRTGQMVTSADEPLSALLADPTEVDGKRLACSAKAPAVVIDLDPAEGLFDPIGLPQSDSTLAVGLGQLRRAGIAIFWVSGHSADVAASIRRSLAVSGLDIEGQDNLLLMRYRDDRKQTRRHELAETHCLVAIAGDTKADFDELFDYLLDPAIGEPLDILLDDGWFLTPLALSQTPSTEE